jgi:hypothetical protein
MDIGLTWSYLLQTTTLGKLHSGSNVLSIDRSSSRSHFLRVFLGHRSQFFMFSTVPQWWPFNFNFNLGKRFWDTYIVWPKSKCTDVLFKCILDSPEITSYLLQSATLGKLHGGSVFSIDRSSTRSHFLKMFLAHRSRFFVCFPQSHSDDPLIST